MIPDASFRVRGRCFICTVWEVVRWWVCIVQIVSIGFVVFVLQARWLWRVGCPVGSICVRLCPYEFAGPEPLDILSAMAGHSDVNRDVVTRMGV